MNRERASHRSVARHAAANVPDPEKGHEKEGKPHSGRGAIDAGRRRSTSRRAAIAQDATANEIAKYRQALRDGNPAELWEARGEGLWKQKRGPKNVSLEKCDLGKGPGMVKGAYAELPRYFADADRVMDLETRLVHCMVTLQGFSSRRRPSVRSAPAATVGLRGARRLHHRRIEGRRR